MKEGQAWIWDFVSLQREIVTDKKRHGVTDTREQGFSGGRGDRSFSSSPAFLLTEPPLAIGIIFFLRLWLVGEAGREPRRKALRVSVLAFPPRKPFFYIHIYFLLSFLFWNEPRLGLGEQTTKTWAPLQRFPVSPPSLQMIGKTIIIPHHCNFGAKIRVASSCSRGYHGSIKGGIYWRGESADSSLVASSTMP